MINKFECDFQFVFFLLNILLGIVGAVSSLSEHKTYAQALAKERRREKLERKIRTKMKDALAYFFLSKFNLMRFRWLASAQFVW